jgi:rhamnosyltransferase
MHVPDEAIPPAVVAVVTSFHPSPEIAELVAALVPQVDRVIVVDDGSGAVADPALEAASAAGADVIRHPANRGIAAALNTGVAAALNTGVAAARQHPRCDYVVTFDQDSRIDDGYVSSLVSVAEEASAAGLRVGMAAPATVEDLPAMAAGRSRGFVLGSEPIQSGLLIRVELLDRIGAFWEPLFIDCVDTDLFVRAQAAGFVVVLATRSHLHHTLGRRHEVTLLGRPLRLVYSATFRYYYLARNRILMNRRHGRGNRVWAVRETLADLRHFAIVLVFVPGRMRRLAAIAAGVHDGWRSRTGRIPESLESRLGVR